MANLSFTHVVASIISATVSVSYASASVSYIKSSAVANPQTELNFTYSIPAIETKISAVAVPQTKIIFDYFVVPMTNIPSVGVIVSDLVPLFNSELFKFDSVSILDSPVLNVQLTKSDSVTMQDAEVIGNNSLIEDSTNVSDVPILNPELIRSDLVSMSDSAPLFNTELNKTDSVLMLDSVELANVVPPFFAYPDSVIINDGDIGGFLMRTTEPHTGVIGSPGLIGQIIVNDDKITIGDDFTGLSAQLS